MMNTSQSSNELEAFIEYISVTRALGKKSVQAYASDLHSIENELNIPLIQLDSPSLLNYLSRKCANGNLSFALTCKSEVKDIISPCLVAI